MTRAMLALLFAALSQIMSAQESVSVAPQLSAVQTANIQRWAGVYGIPADEALEQYRFLMGTNWPKVVGACGFFDKKSAFEIAAAALLEAKDNNNGAAVLYTLERKKDFSPTAFGAVMAKLESLNKDPMDDVYDNGEHGAGIETVKSRLATLVSKWIGIPDPRIDHLPAGGTIAGSKSAYRTFIAQAWAKGATMTGDSPF